MKPLVLWCHFQFHQSLDHLGSSNFILFVQFQFLDMMQPQNYCLFGWAKVLVDAQLGWRLRDLFLLLRFRLSLRLKGVLQVSFVLLIAGASPGWCHLDWVSSGLNRRILSAVYLSILGLFYSQPLSHHLWMIPSLILTSCFKTSDHRLQQIPGHHQRFLLDQNA